MADIESQPPEQPQAPDASPAPDSSLPSTAPQGEWLPREEALVEAVLSRFEARLEYREHQGPLPAPEDFGYYADKIPNGGDRLMRMAEKEQVFQHERAKRQESRATLGVASAWSIVLGVCGLCAYGFSTNHAVEAAGIFGATLVSVVGTFIYGTSVAKRGKDKESAAIEQPKPKDD